MERTRITFRGTVQGVGFRPSIFRCASACGLTGFVRNMRSHVTAEIQGPSCSIILFRRILPDYLPSAARLDDMTMTNIPLMEESSFRIEQSAESEYTLPPIPPDLALCGKCREELLDPSDRRYLYPFITCTQCGPRYTITSETPFDREKTSMAEFEQCPSCLREYREPEDRRFHSQTNSCARCGPGLFLVPAGPNSAGGKPLRDDPLPEVIGALSAGKIVAIQGMGGFHLAADPSVPGTIDRLRKDKARRTKPFALMVRDIDTAGEICLLTEVERQSLLSPLSPILLLPKRAGIPSFYHLVSDTDTLGIMLPYTPLHLLLFFHPKGRQTFKSLIMTSGNLKNEPIITDPREAMEKLSDVADFFLYTDRKILFRTDDSILRTAERREAPMIIRRSRGFVPDCLVLKNPISASTLAVGGDLKNAPALAQGTAVSMLPYMGDCDDYSVRQAFEAGIGETLRLFKIQPERIVSDLHPLYFTSEWARNFQGPAKVSVQHHWAHVLSVMAEQGLEESLGAAFDGTGYGTDGTSWGGEFLLARRDSFRRLGSFKPFPLPGGDSAVLHPKRAAFSLLFESAGPDALGRLLNLEGRETALLSDLIVKKVNAPLSSSMGRLFDAAAALLGIVDNVYYEGEGPIKLESEAYRWLRNQGMSPSLDENIKNMEDLLPLTAPCPSLAEQGAEFMFDPLPLFLRIMESRHAENIGRTAWLVHRAFARALVEGLEASRECTGITAAVLSGGVFQNTLLRQLAVPALEKRGFSIFLNTKVPCNDGGLALGQVYCTAL